MQLFLTICKSNCDLSYNAYVPLIACTFWPSKQKASLWSLGLQIDTVKAVSVLLANHGQFEDILSFLGHGRRDNI